MKKKAKKLKKHIKVKKEKEKEKEKEEQQIVQPVERHEREGNLNFFSEEISHQIIEKILSYVKTEQYKNKLYSKLGDTCYNHIKMEITNFIHSQFITHDRDDVTFDEINPKHQSYFITSKDEISEVTNNNYSMNKENTNEEDPDELSKLKSINEILPTNNLKNKMFFNSSYENENFWGDILPPKCTNKDRNESTQIPLHKSQAENIKNKDNNLKHRASKKLIMMKGKKNMHKSSSSLINNSSIINEEHKKNNKTKSDKGKSPQLSDFPTYKIPPEEIVHNPELPNAKELREEREQQIKKQNEEIMKRLQREMDKKIADRAIRYNPKIRNNQHITTGPSGELLIVRPIPLDRLESEFPSIKSDVKLAKKNPNPKRKKGKDSTSTELDKQEEVIEYNDTRNNKYLINKIFDKNSGNNTNNIDSMTSGKNGNSNNDLNNNNHIEKIIPFGSSYDLFKPEVGVILRENEKVKTGGRDYFKKFKKYSVENFNKALKNTLSMKTFTNFRRINNETGRNKLNNSNSKTVNLLNNNDNGEENKNNNINNNNININDDSENYYENDELNEQKKLNKAASTGCMIMTNYKFPSIKDAIEQNDLYEDVLPINPNMTSTLKQNIFKNTANSFKHGKFQGGTFSKNSTNIGTELNEMNKFAKTLMGGTLWGTYKKNSGGTKYAPRTFNKPLTRDIEREIGSNYTKMPRDRFKQSAQNFLVNNNGNMFNNRMAKTKYCEGKNFFKVD